MSTSTSTRTRTRKTPAKALPAAPEALPAVAATKAEPTKRVYSATGRCGVTVRRTHSAVMTHGIDVAEPQSTSARAQQGRVWGFFATEQAAQAAAARLTEKGLDVLVVKAEEVK